MSRDGVVSAAGLDAVKRLLELLAALPSHDDSEVSVTFTWHVDPDTTAETFVVHAEIGQRVFANTMASSEDDDRTRSLRQVSTGSLEAAFDVVSADVVGTLRSELYAVEARRSTLLSVLDAGTMNDGPGEATS